MTLKDLHRPLAQQVPSKPHSHAAGEQDQVFNARRRLYKRQPSAAVDLDIGQELDAWKQLMHDLETSDQEPLVPVHRVSIAAAGRKNKNVKLYKPPKNNVLVKPSDRTNLLALRIPTPLPDKWLKMNGLPVATVRAQEIAVANVTKDLNDLSSKGYVSPSALWNQQDKMIMLMDKVDGFVADVNGTRVVVNVTQSNATQSVDKAQQVVDSIRQNTPSGQVQKPMDKIAANLTDIIGPPIMEKDSVANPFSPRHEGEKGFSNKDSKQLLDKVEEVKEKQRDSGTLTPKKEKEQEQKDKKTDLALGGGAKSIPSNGTSTVSVKAFHHQPPSPVWISSDEWQG